MNQTPSALAADPQACELSPVQPAAAPAARSAWLSMLRPVELTALAAWALSYPMVLLAGRSYAFLLKDHLAAIVGQFNWLFPCAAARYLFALFKVSPEKARRFYIAYFVVLMGVFFGSDLAQVLSRMVVFGRLYDTVARVAQVNLAFVAVCAVVTLWRFPKDKDHARQALREELRQDLQIVRLGAVLLLMFMAYSNLKPMIPLLRPVLYDQTLHHLDRLQFFNHDPAALLNAIHHPAWQYLMERSYFFFYFFIVFALMGTLLLGSPWQFERTVAMIVVGSLVGLIFYYLIPSVGPAFYSETAPLFQATRANPLKADLLRQYVAFCRAPQTAALQAFGGLAAFPSLHVGHSALFLVVLWRCSRVLGILLILPFLMLCLSTVYLGWHYVTDLWGGLLVAWITWLLAARLVPAPKANTECGLNSCS